MFEERQNTGKSASLAEKYANVLGQLSEESDSRAQAEHALEVETEYVIFPIHGE